MREGAARDVTIVTDAHLSAPGDSGHRRMRKTLITASLLLAAGLGIASDSAATRPFEADSAAVPATQLDSIVRAAQRKRGIAPANPCSDEVFVRRAFLDLIGTLPEVREVEVFLGDRSAGKREALVDALLERPEFADYWALKWCDLLRVKGEYPINLWPNAAQAYHRWVRDAIRENRPYDKFARDLLTASGSNFRAPAVNFFRAIQGRDGQAIAAAVALTFMGERIETWPRARRATTATFFSRVTWKKTAEWKEEIVLDDPAPREAIDAFLPDGTAVRIGPDEDPRAVFADWLVAPGNREFARCEVNRIWAWLFGRGVVHEPDDLRPDNLPVIPGLLEHLEHEFVAAHFDVKHVFRLILNSRTYQQSPIPRADPLVAKETFACYPVRRLDAEVLVDALAWLTSAGEGYTSNTPEPWTFIPADRRTITLADGSVTSALLEMFGRPARDTGLASERDNEPTDAQRLWLLNSTAVQKRIERSWRLRDCWNAARGDAALAVRRTYVTVLSRPPTEAESGAAVRYVRGAGRVPGEAMSDVAWALVNSKEFLYRH